VHRDQQDGRAEVVVRGVRRQVGDGDTGSHHRGLVADHVHAAQQGSERGTVPDVDPVGALGRRGLSRVRLRDHQVHAHHLVPRRLELVGDGRADEPRGAGEEHSHGRPGTW
jgi:hypothetical protein